MLIKWIVCEVRSEQRAAFAAAQTAWSALHGAPGFRGQLGGWDAQGRACIAGLWTDASAYRHFMEHLHDAVTDRNAQEGTYTRSSVALLGAVMDIGPGLCAGPGVLRVADCQVPPSRQAPFTTAQQTIWNPGMGDAPGMLGGVFARGGDRFLVLSRWAGAVQHTRYRTERFPPLRARARPGDDISSITGHVVEIVPSWIVPA